ncbi:MAG: hypothetical protein GC161_10955 [Planctomycetaceae bacterium]|nr:hypothetical protein [Planctomycetaceae bacterium]
MGAGLWCLGLALALAGPASAFQAPPPRPRPAPKPVVVEPEPAPGAALPGRVSADGPQRLAAFAAAKATLPFEVRRGDERLGAAEFGLRRAEFGGAPALEVRTVRRSEDARAAVVEEVVGLYRFDPFLEPLLVSRTLTTRFGANEPTVERQRLVADGRRLAVSDQGNAATPAELWRSQRPLVTDNSIFAFALAMERTEGGTLEVDYLSTAPKLDIVRGARLVVGPTRATPDGASKLTSIELLAPPAEGAAPERLWRALVDQRDRFHSIQLGARGPELVPQTP